MSESTTDPTLEQIATALLELDARARTLRAAMLVAMVAGGTKLVRIAGGTVSYVAASTSPRVDGKACEARIRTLAEQLRAMGANADDSIPLHLASVPASVRVTAARQR